jgi:hypothetical protein
MSIGTLHYRTPLIAAGSQVTTKSWRPFFDPLYEIVRMASQYPAKLVVNPTTRQGIPAILIFASPSRQSDSGRGGGK